MDDVDSIVLPDKARANCIGRLWLRPRGPRSTGGTGARRPPGREAHLGPSQQVHVAHALKLVGHRLQAREKEIAHREFGRFAAGQGAGCGRSVVRCGCQ
jgi:hypothetical protein